jgi:hypothetical protein
MTFLLRACAAAVPCAAGPARAEYLSTYSLTLKSHRFTPVHGGDIWGMIVQEGTPSLDWRRLPF